jgi:hypothetical protein
MTPWTLRVKFPYDTQFIFGSLIFSAGEDENLDLLTQGPVPMHPAPICGKASYYPADPSTSGKTCSGLNPYVAPYYLSAMTSQGLPIGKTEKPSGQFLSLIVMSH